MNVKFLAVAGTVLGTAVGAAAGYFLAVKALNRRYNEQMELEIARVKAYVGEKAKRDILESKGLQVRVPGQPADVDDSVHDNSHISDETLTRVKSGLNRLGPEGVVVSEPKPAEVLIRNIFEEEPKPKKGRKPFVIDEETYHANDSGFAQVELIYYVSDDTLADEKDIPLENLDRLIGRDALDMFDQEGNVYVRNERLNMDYMVTRSAGAYSTEVLGQ